MKYTLIILFIVNTLSCFSQSIVNFKYFETDEKIYDFMFTNGKIEPYHIYNVPFLKYKKDSLTIQSITFNDSSFVTGFSRIHENKKLAFEAIVFGHIKFISSFMGSINSSYLTNNLIKTYYPNGSIRSHELYMYAGTVDNPIKQSVFFDSKSNIVGQNIIFSKDTIEGTFLAKVIINDSIFRYATYNDRKLHYSYYMTPPDPSNPTKNVIYKIVDETTNKIYKTKKEINKIIKKFTFVYFCRQLIISDKKDLYFDEPIKYEYIKYNAANE